MRVKSKVYLVRIIKGVEERNYEITEGLTKIGRHNTQHIRCNSLQVSREHCVIELVRGHVLLRDLQSFNGTYVMNNRIPTLRTHVLNDGDLIGLGVEPPNAEYVFKLVIENNDFCENEVPDKTIEEEAIPNTLKRKSVENCALDPIPKRTKENSIKSANRTDSSIFLKPENPQPLKIISIQSLAKPNGNLLEKDITKTVTNNEIININLDSDDSDNDVMIINGEDDQKENDVDMKEEPEKPKEISTVNNCKDIPLTPASPDNCQVIDPILLTPASPDNCQVIDPIPSTSASSNNRQVIDPIPSTPASPDNCQVIDPIPSTPAFPDNPFEEHPSFSINDEEVILLSDSDDDAEFSSSQLFSHHSETSLLFNNNSSTVNIKSEITENYEACTNAYDDEDRAIEESHSGMFEEHFIHCSQEISASEGKGIVDEINKENEEGVIHIVDDSSNDGNEEIRNENNINLISEKEFDIKFKDNNCNSISSTKETKDLISDEITKEQEENRKLTFDFDNLIKSPEEFKQPTDEVLEKSEEKSTVAKDNVEKSEEKKIKVVKKSKEKSSLTKDLNKINDIKPKKAKEKKSDIKISIKSEPSVSSTVPLKKSSKSIEKKSSVDLKFDQKKSKLISPITNKPEILPEKPAKRCTRKRTSDKDKPTKVARRSDVEKIKKVRREKLKQIALKSKSNNELERLLSEDKTVVLKSKKSLDLDCEKPVVDTIKVSDRSKVNAIVEDINPNKVIRAKLIDSKVKQNKEKLKKSEQVNNSERGSLNKIKKDNNAELSVNKLKENSNGELIDEKNTSKEDRLKKLREWEMNIINNHNNSLNLSKSFEINEKNKRRVRFKEDLVEIRSYECDGHFTRKVSDKENRYRRDVPPPAPVIQHNWKLMTITSYVLYDICKWNVAWLEECKTLKGDPPVLTAPYFSVKDCYINYRDYWMTMYPLLMTELWREIFNDLNSQFGGFKPQRSFTGVVRGVTRNPPCVLYDNSTNGCCLVSLDCVFVCNKDECRRGIAPDEGDIGVMQVIIPKGDNSNDKIKVFRTFTFVTSEMNTVPLHRCQDHFAKYAVVQAQKFNAPQSAGAKGIPAAGTPEECIKNDFNTCLYVHLTMCHSSHKTVIQGATVKLMVFKNLIKSLRIFHSLNRLKNSPLLNFVLNPKDIYRPITNKQLRQGIASDFPLNQSQIDVVLDVSKNLLSGKPSISLIHGPPGTGKTRVISSIVLQILAQNADKNKTNVKEKILLCAPSNAATDSLALRLLEIRQSLPSEKRFKLIRVGATESIHRNVRDISSQNLAEKEVGYSLDAENLKVELRLLEAEETSLTYAVHCAKDETSRNRFTAELIAAQERKRNLECLLNNTSGHQANYAHMKLVREAETKIIQGAEIITTTLNSCCARKITDSFSEYSHLRFAYCIVDEATQGIEQEVLLPLLHNVTSLVLVGDPLQLSPTILSQTGVKYNLNRSLFHRLWREWDSNGNMANRPFYSLSVQHRMHPEISLFPSKQFYGGNLITPDFLNVNLPFEPYTILSHSFSQDSDGESNSKESELVVKLLSEIIKAPEFKGLSIGVIVPYNLHKLILERDLKKMKLDMKYFKVNTIDSFQGQEKDIIIFSCVRSDGIGFLSDRLRLNVALTRARKCLIVIANLGAFKGDYTWKALIDDAQNRGKIREIPQKDNISSLQLVNLLIPRDKRKKSASSNYNK
ncbi:hypothetical protein O3M35_011598 [Rhynocoris fuscipes]|uniref:FHA domain-containing protein n=1 Tax=Rhynocoris fuscipes TaxID=488301 RepID=A0AAW1CWT6_9HEMI